MVVNSLLIFVLDKLFGLYKNPSSWGMIFDAGLLLSLAALIYLPTLLLSLYFFIALALIRPWSWREWMIGLLGLAAPLFFAAVYLFMVDGLQSYLQEVFLPGIRIELSSGQQFQRVQLVSVVLIGLIFLMAVINAQSNYYRNVAKTRVSQQLLLILVPFSLCTLLVAPDAAVYRVGLACIPLVVYLAYFFLAGRNMWIMEACMLLLLAAWTANRLMPF
jgi:hypothetical protein